MTTVGDVMGPVKVGLHPDQPLRAAAAALAEAKTGLAVVTTPDGHGVFTERDLLRALAEGVDLDVTPVQAHMTGAPVAVPDDRPLREACDLMIARGTRHLQVREGDQLVGILNLRVVVGVMSGAAELGWVPPAKGS